MRGSSPADRLGRLVHDGPADVVVAPDVGGPRGVRWLPRQGTQHLRGQARVAGCQRGPELDHEAVVVRHVRDPAVVSPLAQVAHQVTGADDRLGLEDDRRRDDARAGTQGLEQVVDLRLVLAVGAQALPHERDRVEAERLHPARQQRQEHIEHLEEDPRVRPVQVPLEGVEGGPDPPPVGQLGEVARVPSPGTPPAASAPTGPARSGPGRRSTSPPPRRRPPRPPRPTDARPPCG